ncbi:unnamed protein product [Fraxinus pennsylvanica]|uniref:Pentatricopeptide repeat-containing protein n=1 Tax=Fraxinus pennsylvanica TaxID=56036 RepID=A0AAD1ZFS7_9LAMI|nr:unnamed protein product [Fraxinus pennsylvanica]
MSLNCSCIIGNKFISDLMIARQLKLKTFSKIPVLKLRGMRKFCSFYNGRHVLDENPKQNLVPFHRCMLYFIRQGREFEALNTFKKQLQLGILQIDEVAIAIALKACRRDQKRGCQIHGFAITSGHIFYVTVSNSLMNMYCKSKNLDNAFSIFKNLKNPDTVSYNTLLSGYENGEEALMFARGMRSAGVVFDAVSYTCVLAHCAHCQEFDFGIQFHCLGLKFGLESEIFIGNALEGTYGLEAILTFVEMVREGMKLDHVSFTGAVSACGHERNLVFGRQIHTMLIKRGYDTNVSVCNVLISMYSKCDVVDDSKLVFENMIDRNVVSWTTMLSITEEDAVILFMGMRRDGVYPNDVTFVGLIHAVTINNMIQEGLMVHCFCIKTNFISELNVANSFITMYGKFELMEDSIKIFEELDNVEIISWNALISGYSMNGMYQEAVQNFLSASTELRPNHYTFGSVLNAVASSESISLRQGQRFHDMLGRTGSLEAAEEFVNRIPGGPGISVLQSLLGACRIYRNEEMAMRVADALIAKEPDGSGSYVLMSNLFAEKGKWENVAKMRKMMRDRKVKKEIGFSWADVGNVDDSIYMHGFSSGDKSHPLSEAIFRMSELLGSEMKYLEKEEKDHLLFDQKRLGYLESFTINGQVLLE